MTAESWVMFGLLVRRLSVLSLVSVGGAMPVAPDLYRFLVLEQAWLTAQAFTDSITLAQAMPGPNVLFVALLGFKVHGLAGAVVALLSLLIPSSVLTLIVYRAAAQRGQVLWVKALRAGLAPVAIGLLMATAWLMFSQQAERPLAWVLTLATIVMTWRWKLHPLWLIASGALAGVLASSSGVGF